MTKSTGRTIRLAVQSTRRLMRDTLTAYLAGRPDVTMVGRATAMADLRSL